MSEKVSTNKITIKTNSDNPNFYAITCKHTTGNNLLSCEITDFAIPTEVYENTYYNTAYTDLLAFFTYNYNQYNKTIQLTDADFSIISSYIETYKSNMTSYDGVRFILPMSDKNIYTHETCEAITSYVYTYINND